MARSYLKVQTSDATLNRMQTNTEEAIGPLLKSTLPNGAALMGIVLQAGDNTIPHGLNQPLVGWVVTRCRASATFYDKQDANPTPAKNLVLNASAAVTVDLWVY